MSSLGPLNAYLFYLALSAPLDSYHGFVTYLLPIVTRALVNHFLLTRLKTYSSMSRLNYVILPRLPATE